ncbi:hypothetical protein P3X46_006257 [Hevea brasiliensis]|uniref:C2H2-type domain-containing protein n=1 Tax=Hevea brasiliensis TaxID=3981 RepID=A0ABQ9MSA3_HEVBR|nr:zinc finger protein 10-like [Hevea brasiliensis]KAJ9182240.1 hypothetical protein P3X46_006257 [Hevea brasiliensis]
MGSGKQGSSETSSEENDRQEQVKEDAATTITNISGSRSKRSYECTFCKRGFTNAQALGGHMNIHRKDRAKTKQEVTASSSISGKTNEEYMNPNHMGPISSESMNYYSILEAQKNYLMYFRPSGSSSPSLPHGYYHGSDFLVPSHQSSSMNEELLGANLSLQIGSSHLEDNEMNREVSKEDEVDLELRLGHDR